jgi:AcrR family transcriptional regulator
MSNSIDGQKARSLTTQVLLMEAAEKLVSLNGIHNVSIKEIVREANQKNESALQYHFKSLRGLIIAINRRRSAQTREKRSAILAELEAASESPSLRDLCRLMVTPSYLLAKADTKYRRYVRAFGYEITSSKGSAFSVVKKSGGGGESGKRTDELLRAALPHLVGTAFEQRMDFAARLASAAMGNHAKQKNAFRGPKADLFISDLIDAMEGLLSAPISEESRSLG